MLDSGELTEAEKKGFESAIDEKIKAAFLFAENSPFPEISELMTDIYA